MEEVLRVGATKRPKDTCAFWLQKRKRFCRTKPVVNHDFCESHLAKTASESLSEHVVETFSADNDKPVSDFADTVSQSNSAEICDQSVEKRDPPPDQCHFWLQRKMRFCKARVSSAQLYCVEHSVNAGIVSKRARVLCPNDSKHSCYADQLERHLKKCNARIDLRPIYFVEGINAGEMNPESTETKVRIHDIEVAELNSIIDMVMSLHQENITIESSIHSHDVLQQEIDKPSNGNVALKHLHQQSSLIANLELLGLLRDRCNYVEFGAGRGGLSHWIQLANKSNTNTKYLLVDRSSVRYKKDSYHKGENQGPNFERLKIDIENLDLNKVESLSSNAWPLVGTGKHLCGAATDLMLRCLGSTMSKQTADQHHCEVEGLLVALCCHHRCDWKAYVGKEWFIEHGIGPRQFRLIAGMSAWATCGMKHSTDAKDDLKEGIVDKDANLTSYDHPRYGSLLPEKREEIGFKCKQLIDRGRIHYLMTRGFTAKLIYYVDRNLTLENTALVAVLDKTTSVLASNDFRGDDS